MGTVELDRLSFVVQQVVDILLEKSQNNYEHLHTVDLIINSLLEYLQRLRASIPLESVVPHPKLSVEIVLLYGLSKLYIREEPHVSIGLKMLLPLLAQLRADDKVVNQAERNQGLGSGTGPDSIESIGTEKNNLLGTEGTDSAEGISSSEVVASASLGMEDPGSVDADDTSHTAPGADGSVSDVALSGTTATAATDSDSNGDSAPPVLGDDICSDSFALLPASDYDKEFARKELEGLERCKHDSQTFLLRQRLRVAEELTHIGAYLCVCVCVL